MDILGISFMLDWYKYFSETLSSESKMNRRAAQTQLFRMSEKKSLTLIHLIMKKHRTSPAIQSCPSAPAPNTHF